MKYRKKPVIVDAWLFDGTFQSAHEIINIATTDLYTVIKCEYREPEGICLIIDTLEGSMIGKEGDYIIRGVNGEFYPCKPDIFAKTYELIGE